MSLWVNLYKYNIIYTKQHSDTYCISWKARAACLECSRQKKASENLCTYSKTQPKKPQKTKVGLQTVFKLICSTILSKLLKKYFFITVSSVNLAIITVLMLSRACQKYVYKMLVFKFCELTLRMWCSWANSAMTLLFIETASRNWPHRAISKEHNCARFILTISASSSGLSAFCCNMKHIENV